MDRISLVYIYIYIYIFLLNRTSKFVVDSPQLKFLTFLLHYTLSGSTPSSAAQQHIIIAPERELATSLNPPVAAGEVSEEFHNQNLGN